MTRPTPDPRVVFRVPHMRDGGLPVRDASGRYVATTACGELVAATAVTTVPALVACPECKQALATGPATI